MPRLTFAVLAVAALALSACNREDKKASGAGSAAGEILPGSASDAMLPLDTVRSQAPLAPKVESSAKPGADKAAASEAAAPAAEAPAEPASAPEAGE